MGASSGEDRAVVNGAGKSVSALRASVPSAFESVPVEEFRSRLRAQGVENRHMAVVCPMCGTVQSMASLVEAGASVEQAERRIGFSCEGRFTGAGYWPAKPTPKRKAVRGCDWSLGGLFQIHKLEVVTEDGERHPRFTIATPQDAQTLAQAIEARRAETQGGSVHESAVRTSECAPASSPNPDTSK